MIHEILKKENLIVNYRFKQIWSWGNRRNDYGRIERRCMWSNILRNQLVKNEISPEIVKLLDEQGKREVGNFKAGAARKKGITRLVTGIIESYKNYRTTL